MSEENKDFAEMPEDGTNANEQPKAEEASTEQEAPSFSVFGSEPPRHESIFAEEPKKKKEPKKISLTAFICSAVALVVAAVMLTYTLCSSAYQVKLAESKIEDASQNGISTDGGYSTLDILEKIFETYSFEELDEETIENEILKAYVRATGDEYAEYYTREEYAALQLQMAGVSQGIGISIINSTVTINEIEYKTLKVINVMKDSPAERAGILIGDCIIAVGTEDDYETVSKLNYDQALAQLRGESGTVAEFGYYRPSTNTTTFASILREAFIEESVMSKNISDVSENTGLVKILSFDATTPSQLTEAVDALKAEGCEKFVFDLRYNPGGQLGSIAEILSYFLDEGDTIISMSDKMGNTEVIRAEASEKYGIKAENIGKYKYLNMVVLCNENTASAAELFVANFRDHGIGKIIGTTTYGKGTVQTYINAINVNGQTLYLDGVLKLTVYMYYPPNGESYDGLGIEPDVKCEMSEASENKNIYDIMGTTEDDQLVEAVKHFK